MLVTRYLFKALKRRSINSTVRLYQVCVLGGASEIGQTISLMLRTEPAVSKLVVHDTNAITPGVIIELSHIPVKSALRGYLGEASMKEALNNADLVLLVGGLIKTPGVSDNYCLEANAEFVKTAVSHISRMPKMPFVGIVTEPINIMVPMAAELMRNKGMFDARKMFGVTTIDWLRAQILFATHQGVAPENCLIPVIGGHSNKTTIPLVSHSKPEINMTEGELLKFVKNLQEYDDAITRAKNGESPTISIAFSVLLFARQILSALDGFPAEIAAFVEDNEFGTSFFSGLVHVDSNGINEIARYANVSKSERDLLEKAIVELKKDVSMGKQMLEADNNENKLY